VAGEARKIYYSISEVCARTGLEPHVLRYWESEFPQLRPKKNRAGNRAYREKDIEIIQYVKHLLYVEQYTIPGAKKKLAAMRDAAEFVQTEPPLPPAAHPAPQAPAGDIHAVITELRDLLKLMRS
jgi:DNA-binding transcriptional MerR regulator